MKSRRSPQSGFSLIEMLVTVIVIVGFVAAMATVISLLVKDKKMIMEVVNTDLDTILTEKIVFQDLLNSSPSLNNTLVIDDFGNNFFDYYPDISSTSYRSRIDRALTLAAGAHQEIYFILNQPRMGSPITYSAVAAYATTQPVSPAQRGGLNFSSLNRNNYVNSLSPNLWRDGQVIMLDTPARLRPANANPSLVAPRSGIFVGQVQGNALTPLTPPFIRRDHPTQGITIDSADLFLRSAPSMGGTSPVIRLQPVEVVRYYLKASTTQNGAFDVFRQTYSSRSFGSDQLLAKGITSMKFERKSVLSPSVTFSLTTPETSPGVYQ